MNKLFHRSAPALQPGWFFVTDLHGQIDRYNKLFTLIRNSRPRVVLIGGDILPTGFGLSGPSGLPYDNFVAEFLAVNLKILRSCLQENYPSIFLILGNDDPRAWEKEIEALDADGLLHYIHTTRYTLDDYTIYGYACVPPSPFFLKDWERYDVSRGVDPGCVSPEEGHRTVDIPPGEVRYGTIKDDLDRLTAAESLDNAIMLFHSPPYGCRLDRAALDGRMVDHVPLDVHVGSIAIQRFIAERQPLLTLHGHIHESTRLTGAWREQFGRTWSFNAAHDGPELCVIRFDPAHTEQAERELL